MPLMEIRQLTPATRLGLWRMERMASSCHEKPRQRERRNTQLLLDAMMGGAGFAVGHEESGKPFLALAASGEAVAGWALSVSHTLLARVPQAPTLSASDPKAPAEGYGAMLLSRGERVGVDIEVRSDRVERIASRFIHPDEQAATTDEKLLLWSAKEAVYKLFSEDRLQFFDMRATAIAAQSLRMENLKRNIVVDVCFEFTDDYVLTFAVLPALLTSPGPSVRRPRTTASG